jgi:hypothetical protein
VVEREGEKRPWAVRCGKCGAELPGWLDKPVEDDDRAYQRWRLEPCGECGWSPENMGVR